MIPMTYEDAVEFLRSAVKESHLDNQRHIDLSVIDADKREKAQKALISVRTYMANGDVKESQVKKDLGLS